MGMVLEYASIINTLNVATLFLVSTLVFVILNFFYTNIHKRRNNTFNYTL